VCGEGAPALNPIDPSSRDNETASVETPTIGEANIVGSHHHRHMDLISAVWTALAIKWDGIPLPQRLTSIAEGMVGAFRSVACQVISDFDTHCRLPSHLGF
jgi:hypothetical protein